MVGFLVDFFDIFSTIFFDRKFQDFFENFRISKLSDFFLHDEKYFSSKFFDDLEFSYTFDLAHSEHPRRASRDPNLCIVVFVFFQPVEYGAISSSHLSRNAEMSVTNKKGGYVFKYIKNTFKTPGEGGVLSELFLTVLGAPGMDAYGFREARAPQRRRPC